MRKTSRMRKLAVCYCFEFHLICSSPMLAQVQRSDHGVHHMFVRVAYERSGSSRKLLEARTAVREGAFRQRNKGGMTRSCRTRRPGFGLTCRSAGSRGAGQAGSERRGSRLSALGQWGDCPRAIRQVWPRRGVLADRGGVLWGTPLARVTAAPSPSDDCVPDGRSCGGGLCVVLSATAAR